MGLISRVSSRTYRNMDLQGRLERIEQKIGDAGDNPPSQVLNAAQQKINATRSNNESGFVRFHNLTDNYGNLCEKMVNGEEGAQGSSARLEALHAELRALDVEKELDKLNLLEPVVDKSRETFHQLTEQEVTAEHQEVLDNLAVSVDQLQNQLVNMTEGYAKEVKDINQHFKRLEKRILEKEQQLEALQDP